MTSARTWKMMPVPENNVCLIGKERGEKRWESMKVIHGTKTG